jgi:hypothetical protein
MPPAKYLPHASGTATITVNRTGRAWRNTGRPDECGADHHRRRPDPCAAARSASASGWRWRWRRWRRHDQRAAVARAAIPQRMPCHAPPLLIAAGLALRKGMT